ncbi:hypothetical protein [Peterkaempfera bronchialis]|uniref:Uncharacterized protein n=1 Tax=Peterkaempfera bronchialis TaxID=2126346 RepID=A0A345SXE8_9ACTN|nr:hypothetical protein [Peterkaempfera bronchialis]AXI78403.1 hypothetical protein C7M71_014120 [Peterkaempfera bronchialis]
MTAPDRPAAEVREVCRQGLCFGCPGNYEVWVHGCPIPAVIGRCGHHCHDGEPVKVTWQVDTER